MAFAGQIDRRQRLAASFERLERVDRRVHAYGFGDRDVFGGHAAGGGVLAELEQLRDFPALLRLHLFENRVRTLLGKIAEEIRGGVGVHFLEDVGGPVLVERFDD